jgi:hypothetical protein
MDGLIDELIEPLMKNEQAQKMLSQNAAQWPLLVKLK